MARVKKNCITCGKLFTPCAECSHNNVNLQWRKIACSVDCAAEYYKKVLMANTVTEEVKDDVEEKVKEEVSEVITDVVIADVVSENAVMVTMPANETSDVKAVPVAHKKDSAYNKHYNKKKQVNK